MIKKMVFLTLITAMFLFQPLNVVYAESEEPPTDSETQESEEENESSDASSCFSLDVIFLIDHSTSMSGDIGQRASDPENQRIFAPTAMLERLSNIALDQCPDTFQRMAVVAYGTQPEVQLGLSNINPNNFPESRKLLEGMKNQIDDQVMGQTAHWEAFKQAKCILDGSEGMRDDPFFRNCSSTGAPLLNEGGPRKRVIIFLTDGVPCVEEWGCGLAGQQNSNMDVGKYAEDMAEWVNENFPFDETLKRRETCLLGLHDLYADDLTRIPADEVIACMQDNPVEDEAYQNSTYIYTFLLPSEQEFSNSIRQVYEEMSESHMGQLVELSRQPQDLPSTYDRVVSRLAGVKTARVVCGNFAVNPYLERADLVFYKFNPDIEVKLTYKDSQGDLHSITNNQSETGGFDVAAHYTEGPNERYIFNYPYPGVWQLEADCDKLDAYYTDVVIDQSPADPSLVSGSGHEIVTSEIPQYTTAPYYNPDNPEKQYYIRYRMDDVNEKIILQSDMDFFKVDVTLVITQPDENPVEYPMEWKAENSFFITRDPIKIPLPGPYTVSIEGRVRTRNTDLLPVSPVENNLDLAFPHERTIFKHENLSFTAFPVTGFEIRAEQPQNDAILSPIFEDIRSGWPLKTRPFDIAVRVVSQEGNSAMAEIFTDPAQPITAKIVAHADSEVASADNPLPEERPIILRPDPGLTGRYIGTVTDYPFEGDISIQYDLTGDYTEHYYPVNTEASVDFVRQSGPIQNRPLTYRVLLVILIILLLLFIIWQVYIHTNALEGSLVFVNSLNEPLESLGLKTGKRYMNASKTWIRSHGNELDLKSIKVESLGKRKTTKTAAGSSEIGGMSLDADREYSNSQYKGVRIKYTLRADNSSHYVNLAPGDTETYSAVSLAPEIRYVPPDDYSSMQSTF